MKLKTLILDDDCFARQLLRRALNDVKTIEVVGEAADAGEALALINALDYNVVFLEIPLPGMNGLELARHVQKMDNGPCIIFVTAYPEYAVSAFGVGAVDYLLKPVNPAMLSKAVDKAYKLAQDRLIISQLAATVERTADEKSAPASKNDARRHYSQIDRIPAGKQGRTILVTESDIFYAFTLQDSVYIKTETDKLFSRFTLKELEARLNQQYFFRSHRCYLVNLNKVKEIVPFFNGTYNLIVDDKERSEVPVSRAQVKKLKKILGI